MLNGNVLSQLEPSGKGIHLFWSGLNSWVYSPGGWNIQRRQFSRRRPSQCDVIAGQLINRLRVENELRLPFGWLSYRIGKFDDITPAEIFRLDLDETVPYVQLNIQAKLGFSYALHRGKVVATVTPKNSGNFTISFTAPAIDAVVSYILDPQSVQYCILPTRDTNEQSWNDVPYLVKDLQLPLAELDPSLHTPDDEFQLAKSRLLPGEDLDRDEFSQLTDILRPTIQTTGHPRHIDKVILLRDDDTAGFEELNATAPLLSLISHPKWRRVMGFGWFDRDSALQPGQVYEYRITGYFPLEDMLDRVYGFHTISSNTSLPSCFFLNDLLLRFSQPPQVKLAPGTSLTGGQQISRRGIGLTVPDQFYWSFPVLNSWSVVLDFPAPIKQVQLELQKGHDFEYEVRSPGDVLVDARSLPAGEIVKIDFPVPVTQMRLKGNGFLFTVRTTQPVRGLHAVTQVLPPVMFDNTPPPASPAFFSARNLQEIAAGNAQDVSVATSATRSALGFQLQWEASLQNGLTYWPPDEITAPPVESTIYQIEHRQIPDTGWKPILPQENWILGHRRSNEGPASINQGVDLMQLFPEMPLSDVSSNQRMQWDDVFDFSLHGEPVARPVPELGTSHQYRIRAIDIIGRPGTTWLESNIVDLRKLIPPPVPVGPVPVVNDEPDFASPNGVHARLLVKDAPDLTPEERLLLGSDQNLILLKWGWHKEQRDLDPYTTEFRVYVRNKAPDSIEGVLVSVVQQGTGRFEGTFQLESPIQENAARNSFIHLGGYPYFVQSHEAGTNVKMILERRIPDENGQLSGPPPGFVSIPRLIGSDLLQSNTWSARAGIVPLTTATAYSFEFRNALQLSVAQPVVELWVGVTASDDQSYVEDKLAPLDNRKGNESPVVPVRVQGRLRHRPLFEIPPPLEQVPRVTTREPEGAPIQFELDAAAFLDPGTLAGFTHIRLERAGAGIVFNQYKVTANGRLMATDTSAVQPDVEVTVSNPDDKVRIVQALRKTDASVLADQYLVFLAGAHPYRASFFEPVTPDPVAPGPIADSFLPQTNRYVYRIRAGNAAGLISSGDAMLKVVVRIPSLKPGPIPERIPLHANAQPGTIRLRIAPDEAVTHLVIFYAPAVSATKGPAAGGSLLRIANRPDLYPDKILRFRSPQGDFAQQFVKALNEPDIETDENGVKTVEYTLEEDEGSEWRLWACTLTRDGIASEPAGPWRIPIPVMQP